MARSGEAVKVKFEELAGYLQYSDRVRVYKGNDEVFCGHLGLLLTGGSGIEHKGALFMQYKDNEVRKFRVVPEINHKQWRELNLMRPLEPNETPDFSFSDLQMSIYYTIYI
jgi:hypothetical protein